MDGTASASLARAFHLPFRVHFFAFLLTLPPRRRLIRYLLPRSLITNQYVALICGCVALYASSSFQARASGAMSQSHLVSQAKLVVIGKLSDRVERDAIWATATLTIRETLKGDAALKKLTLKFLAQPGTTAGGAYAGDEDGIWFLEKEGVGEQTTWSTFSGSGMISTTSQTEEGRKEIAQFLEAAKKLIAEETKPGASNQTKTDK